LPYYLYEEQRLIPMIKNITEILCHFLNSFKMKIHHYKQIPEVILVENGIWFPILPALQIFAQHRAKKYSKQPDPKLQKNSMSVFIEFSVSFCWSLAKCNKLDYFKLSIQSERRSTHVSKWPCPMARPNPCPPFG